LEFESTRGFLLERVDAAKPMVQKAIDLLAEPVPGGALKPYSPEAAHLDAIIGATLGSSNLVQETLLWYGQLRNNAALPAPLETREPAVLAHLMTATQGLARTDGMVRAMIDVGQTPLDGKDMWRFQALAEAEDALTFLQETRILIEGLTPRAAGADAAPARV